jgi:hypothetical protein
MLVTNRVGKKPTNPKVIPMAKPLSNRRIHYWLGIVSALPVLVILVTGLMLQLKKQVPWVQPPEQKGGGTVPSLSLETVFQTCQTIPEAGVKTWKDISRIDIRPAKGIMKVLARNGWEIQLDSSTGSVLQVAYRRSDLIESFHDGSWFGEWTKLGIFLPAAIILLVLWVTGLVLFFQPLRVKWRRQIPC